MSSSANVLAINALEELKGALNRFGSEAREALNAAELELQRTLDWLQERQGHWRGEVRRRQAEVEQARAALARCQASGHRDQHGNYHVPNCAAYEQSLLQAQLHLREAEAELANAQKWSRLIEHAVQEYQQEAKSLANALADDLPRAAAVLGRSVATLQSYAQTSGAGSTSVALPTTSLSTVAGVWEKQGIQDVPLEQIDLSDSHVHNADDFEKVSYEEMVEGLRKLEEVVHPAVRGGAHADYFSQLDAEQRLDYAHGYLKVYESFYAGDGPIKLEKIGDRYKVDHGHHRLFVARQLGLKTIPASVKAWTSPGSTTVTPATSPEFREGNVGGPERRG
jgi:hypothetical protein